MSNGNISFHTGNAPNELYKYSLPGVIKRFWYRGSQRPFCGAALSHIRSWPLPLLRQPTEFLPTGFFSVLTVYIFSSSINVLVKFQSQLKSPVRTRAQMLWHAVSGQSFLMCLDKTQRVPQQISCADTCARLSVKRQQPEKTSKGPSYLSYPRPLFALRFLFC
jgi:hypothetical protein